MKKQEKISFLPMSKLGKFSAWIVVIAIIMIFGQYWIALATQSNCTEKECTIGNLLIIQIVLSWVMLAGLCICGITSIISIIKYKDFSIILFVTALLGVFGILFLIGEFAFPH